MPQPANVFFLSHGGGPLPLLGEPSHKDMVECLQTVAAKIKKPSAILMISAHWEAQPISITAHSSPLHRFLWMLPTQAVLLPLPIGLKCHALWLLAILSRQKSG
nr:hypothetical protein [Pseudoalteromonas ostreae]